METENNRIEIKSSTWLNVSVLRRWLSALLGPFRSNKAHHSREVLAERAAHERFAEGFKAEDAGYDQEEFDSLDALQQREIVQDWVLSVEVEANCTHNPVIVRCGELQTELGLYGHSTKFLEYPLAPGTENMKDRIKALKNATLNGAECVVKTPDLGEVKRTCWLPNFNTPYFSGLGLMEEIAQLMALDWIKRQRESKSAPKPPTGLTDARGMGPGPDFSGSAGSGPVGIGPPFGD
jgi:hypothetical protein